MSKVATLAITSMLAFGFAGIGMAQTVTRDDQGVTVTVKGGTHSLHPQQIELQR